MELIDRSRDAVQPPTFGASLRAARLSRNIALDAVAAHTKINRAFLQDLERNDLSKWPSSQFYRETYLRAYAEAIGLDPRETIEGFRREFGATGAASTTAPSSRPRRLTPVTIPIILAMTFVVAYSLARWLGPGSKTSLRAVPEPVVSEPVATAPAPAEPTSIELPAPQPETQAPAVSKPIEGELLLTSTPPGARVLVNGINRGITPVNVQYLPAGSYSIRFVQSGYVSVTRRVTISAARRRVPVSVALEPATPAE